MDSQTRSTNSDSKLHGVKIALGISGGIAAYKAPLIIRLLIKAGAEVRALATSNALQFTTKATLETLSESALESELFPEGKTVGTQHIDTAAWADLFLLAPVTANLIGKIASGISDDVLTSTLCAYSGPVMLAPSMNTNMYENPVTKKNLKFLRSIGFTVIDPDVGEMACHTHGVGRMAEPERILSVVEEFFGNSNITSSVSRKTDSVDLSLRGKKVVVTAGPCREMIDPVRYISNFSSGKMGYALAAAACELGADVTLISGPTNLPPPADVAFVSVVSTEDMLTAVLGSVKSADMLLMAAAPVDYAPVAVSDSKIKKSFTDLELSLKATPDILVSVSNEKSAKLFVVGFALETDALVENAMLKLKSKDLDMIVANPAGVAGAGPDSDTNCATIIARDGSSEETNVMSKVDLADLILDRAAKLHQQRNANRALESN